MQYDSKVLLREIQQKREKMIEIANAKGYTSDDTVRHSEELDRLIFEYQNVMNNSKRTEREPKYYYKKRNVTFPESGTLLREII